MMATTRGGGDTVDHSFLQTFHPNGTQNPYGIDDPALTPMIDAQRQLLDIEERRDAYRAVERYILDQVYIAPGVRSQGFMFWKSEIMGYRFGLSGGGNVKTHLFERSGSRSSRHARQRGRSSRGARPALAGVRRADHGEDRGP